MVGSSSVLYKSGHLKGVVSLERFRGNINGGPINGQFQFQLLRLSDPKGRLLIWSGRHGFFLLIRMVAEV